MGQVYVISNPAMRRLLKIGFTQRSVYERVQELSNQTGVPVAYQIELIIDSNNAQRLEAALHSHLRRYSFNKEFFELTVQKATLEIKTFIANNPHLANNISGRAADNYLTVEEKASITKKKRRKSTARQGTGNSGAWRKGSQGFHEYEPKRFHHRRHQS